MVRVCKSNIIFLCLHPWVRRPSICLSHYLLLNHCAEFNETCYITSPPGKVVWKQRYFAMCPLSVHLSIMLSPHKPLGGIQPNVLATSLPLMIKVCESNIFFLCVHCPSICPSPYLLLTHWAEFNQTCFITSPHGKGVQEQHYFSMLPSSIHLSVTLSPLKPLEGIQPNLLHHFPSW